MRDGQPTCDDDAKQLPYVPCHGAHRGDVIGLSLSVTTAVLTLAAACSEAYNDRQPYGTSRG